MAVLAVLLGISLAFINGVCLFGLPHLCKEETSKEFPYYKVWQWYIATAQEEHNKFFKPIILIGCHVLLPIPAIVALVSFLRKDTLVEA